MQVRLSKSVKCLFSRHKHEFTYARINEAVLIIMIEVQKEPYIEPNRSILVISAIKYGSWFRNDKIIQLDRVHNVEMQLTRPSIICGAS